MQFIFKKPVTVEGVPHAAGEVIDEADIPTGAVLSDWIEPYVPPPPEPEPPPAAEAKQPDPVPATKPAAAHPVTTKRKGK